MLRRWSQPDLLPSALLALILKRCGYSAQPAPRTSEADTGLPEIFWTRVAKGGRSALAIEDEKR